MTQILGPRNHVAYALFNARGGVRGHLMIGVIVTLLLTGLVLLTCQLSFRPKESAAMWAGALLVIQSIIFGLAAFAGITTAVRTSVTSGMQDSLRLMRAGPAAVVAGYLVGGASHALVISLPCIIIGAICSGIGGVGIGPYVWASLIMTCAGAMLMFAAVYMGMFSKFAAVPMIIAGIFVPMSVTLSAVVPALTLIGGPIAGRGVLELRHVEVEPTMVLSLLAQAAMSTVFFIAAMRSYRSPGKVAFKPDLGFAVISLWSVFGLVSMLFWPILRPRLFSAPALGTEHIVGSLVSGLIIGLVAVAAIARTSADAWVAAKWGLAQSPREAARAKVMYVLVATMAAACIAWVPTLYLYPMVRKVHSGFSLTELAIVPLLACIAFFVACGVFARRMFARTKAGPVLLVVFALGTLLAGPLFEWLRLLANGFSGNVGRPWGVAFSPAGVIILLFEGNGSVMSGEMLWTGVIGQLVFAALMVLVCRLPRPVPRSAVLPQGLVTERAQAEVLGASGGLAGADNGGPAA